MDVIKRNMHKLCDRISALADAWRAFDLGTAIPAVVRDVAFDFILGRNDMSVEKEDSMGRSRQVWQTTKHLRFIGPMLKCVPIDWLIMNVW